MMIDNWNSALGDTNILTLGQVYFGITAGLVLMLVFQFLTLFSRLKKLSSILEGYR
jgi:hypothetical protein